MSVADDAKVASLFTIFPDLVRPLFDASLVGRAGLGARGRPDRRRRHRRVPRR
jgi:hypothetical protein